MHRSSSLRVNGCSVSLMVAIALLVVGISAPTAQAQELCRSSIPIINNGFEEPMRPPGAGDFVTSLPGWTVAGPVFHAPGSAAAFSSGSQFVQMGSPFEAGSVSQALDGAELAGSTVTLTIIGRFGPGSVSLGSQAQGVPGSTLEQTHAVTFTVPSDTSGGLTLTLSSNDWFVDRVSGTYEVPCPDPDPVLNPACADAVNGVGPFAGARVIYAQLGVPTSGGTGSQVIIGTSGADVIDGGSGNDLICGGGGDDTITGGSGNDVVYGDEDNDQLFGQSGGDRLDGGSGSDVCDGGTGSNQVVACEG